MKRFLITGATAAGLLLGALAAPAVAAEAAPEAPDAECGVTAWSEGGRASVQCDNGGKSIAPTSVPAGL